MNYYFSSDWHLGHFNILHSCKRPFSTTDQMNKAIFNEYLCKIGPGDHFYFLGDFSFSERLIDHFFDILFDRKRVHFFWILGNHDLKFKSKIEKLEKQINNLHVYDGIYDIKIQDISITLSHYPMITWNKSHWGAWQLYGHSHGLNTNDIFKIGKQLNVGVDDTNFKILDFFEIRNKMEKMPDNWNLIRK